MERNTLTEIKNLQTGDRFYKAKDPKKEVWQKCEGEIRRTKYQTYKHFATKEKMLYPQPFNANTPVVFLRHNELANVER